ncbi:MAG: hypothetical protein ACFCBV_09880 [Phycisphaerales bacterium]
MTFYVYGLGAFLTFAAIVASVLVVVRPWLAFMGWHPGRIHRAIRRAEAQGLPVCGSCGHPVARWGDGVRLPTNCGECGAVYARCGIVSRATIARAAPSTITVGALLAPLSFIATMFAYGASYEALTPAPQYSAPITALPRPALVRRTAEFRLQPSRVEGETIFRTTSRIPGVDEPPFTLMYVVDIIGQGDTLGGSAVHATDGRVTIELRGPSVPSLDLAYRPATDSWSLTGAGSNSAPLTGLGAEQAIAALYASGGLALRPWADAEMCEAVDRLRTMSSSSRTVNGFVQTGHPSEAAHEHDTAMVAGNRVGTGEGTASVLAGSMPWGWQGTTIPTPVPAHAKPLALVAGAAVVLVYAGVLLVYARTRAKRLSEGATP